MSQLKQFCARVLKLVRDYDHNLALKAVARRSIPNIQIRQVAWIPPPFNWKKVNMDGSFLSDSNLASCGSISRDHNGNFVAAWSLNLGHYSKTLGYFLGPYHQSQLRIQQHHVGNRLSCY